MKGLKKQHNLLWFKAYILIIALVCAAFLSFNIFAQAQAIQPSFCSKTEAVNVNSQVINCNADYHVEGNTCAFNTPVPGTNWLGNTFNGVLGQFVICGNGVVESGEECDDGNTIDTDACTNSCHWTVMTDPDVIQSSIQINSSADGVIFSDRPEANLNETVSVSGGTYVKLSKAMFTPYLYVALANIDKVAKIRTFSNCIDTTSPLDGIPDVCFSRTASGWSTTANEYPGQTVAIIDVGDNPSRTAVNVETGDVWVGNRGDGGGTATGVNSSIMKIDINGNVVKTCDTTNSTIMGGHICLGPRGVAIAENGDVWVGCYLSSGGYYYVYLIPGSTDSSCTPTVVVSVDGSAGAGPYGLAIDSNGNVFVSNRGTVSIQKINANGTIVGSWPVYAGSPYGITVDLDDNAWAGGWSNNKVYTTKDVAINNAAFPINVDGYVTGIGTALDGTIWGGGYTSNNIIRINPTTRTAITPSITSSGLFNLPRGMAGDSAGYMWMVNNSDNKIFAYTLGGSQVINTVTGPTGALPYSYSDMTGLNRAMVMRSGFYQVILNSSALNQHWGNIEWDETIAANQNISVFVRASDTNNPATNDMGGATWRTTTVWNDAALATKAGQYLQIKAELGSNVKGWTPVFLNLRIVPPPPTP